MQGRIQNANNESIDGELCLAKHFPGLAKSIYGSDDKFKKLFGHGKYCKSMHTKLQFLYQYNKLCTYHSLYKVTN